MKESDLKTCFRILNVSFEEFKTFMIGKTISTVDNEFYYYSNDIDKFIRENYRITRKL